MTYCLHNYLLFSECATDLYSQLIYALLIFNSSLAKTPNIKTRKCCEMQSDLSGSDGFNQQSVNCDKGLNITDVHVCVKVLHCRFNF